MADSPFTNEDLETISRTWNSNKYTEHTAMVLAKELLQARAALSHAAGQDGEQCRAASGEDAYVIEQMGRLLAEIAIIVNGPEPAMTRWSYHDLPEKVRALSRGVPEGST